MNDKDLLTTSAAKSKHQDFSHTARTNSGLTPYSGPWTLAEVKHLLRRAMFGSPKADADYFVGLGVTASINELMTPPVTPPAPPIWTYDPPAVDPNVTTGNTWVTAPFYNQASSGRRKSFKGWWLGQMLNQTKSIEEKMTLFWSNHFSTSLETGMGTDARYAYATNALCRQYALGNFKTLTKLITIDPGMLYYLNGYANTVTAPDENYGRELQELFTVGKDVNGNPYYTQADVIAASHVLTGWQIDATLITGVFTPSRHDTADKTFSAYYNNTVITGQSGAAGANEVDDLMNMIFAKDEVALNIVRKLYRFFVYYDIDATTETNVIQPLAATFRTNNYEIAPVLNQLFSSEHFFDVLNRGCLIKAPVDLIIGFCRDFGVVFPDSSTLTNIVYQYSAWYKFTQKTSNLIQNLADPPSVAGWPAYYQAPQYHEMWINAVTLPARNAFTDQMLNSGIAVSPPDTSWGGSIMIAADIVAYTGTMTTPNDPVLLIQEVIDRHYSEDVSQTVKDYLKNILLGGQISNSYWTIAWDDYFNNPGNTMYYNIVYTRLTSMYMYLMDLSEYQLS